MQSNIEVFKERNAWLQRTGMNGPTLEIIGAPEEKASGAAARELSAGLTRLGFCGPQAGKIILDVDKTLPEEGYRIGGGKISGGSDNGLLYGAFAFLRELAQGKEPFEIKEESAPKARFRVLNHWDSVSGKVERGYSGNSLFFKDSKLCFDESEIIDYARLIASVGINAICLNNVNVPPDAARLIFPESIEKLKSLAAIFRQFGIRVAVSVAFDSPVIDGLDTADPLDEAVSLWWNERASELYRNIPDFAGFVVKADSEFRGGPAALGRTQADGANMLARALAPHGGTVFWRCFIYDCLQDWRDQSIDRPKAPYELFMPQDGMFDENVVLQIKHGPVDFQVREPNSPLLGAMKHTAQGLELQITQEYTGQQIDLYCLPVQWEEILAFPEASGGELRSIIGSKITTIAGVANCGKSSNWTGHALAQLNLYGFGRMAWDPSLSAREVAGEWARLTFGEPWERVRDLCLKSREAYEKYTTPLALGWMVNIHHHYGPSPEGYEFMKWGSYHRASHSALGVDRTSKGTGLTKQYNGKLAETLDDMDACPEELLLFFHRVPFNYRLKSGKTLLQRLYDDHFEGAEMVEGFIAEWLALKSQLAPEVFESVSKKLALQLENAKEWRDVVNTYFYRLTETPDEAGRKIYV
ncbi:MAG: alpha-glucuronidase [Clostridiales bacterium]|jgi:alpha-glucuronidase|nr:alpha-glucuronidase [Clostridiales bacterium]